MHCERISATVAPMRRAPMPLSLSTVRESTPHVGAAALGAASPASVREPHAATASSQRK
jgi:hypothetical protein